MSPHDELTPMPRTVDVDVSAILIHPRLPESAKPGGMPKSGIDNDQSKEPGSSYDLPIGPFGWVSINFVLGSCLIAIFCTQFLSENVQYFRRRAHLRDDIVYSPGAVSLMNPQTSGADSSQLLAGVQLNLPELAALNRQERDLSTAPFPSAQRPLTENQSLALPPNVNRISDTGTIGTVTEPANTVAGNGVSRATGASSASSSSTQKTTSVRSTATRSTRTLRKQSLSLHARNSNARQSLRHQLSSNSAKFPGSKSIPQTAGNLKLGNQQSLRGAEIHSAASPNQMSMHQSGQGGLGPQLRGSMNPMHMESGMLAEPATGGFGGNGLGEAGHHAHVRR